MTANQAVAPPEYFAMLNQKLGPIFNANLRSYKWVYGYRGQRINELIKQLAPHTITTYQTIQGDNKYLRADEILPTWPISSSTTRR